MSKIGKVVQVIGPVIDVEFKPEDLPEIYTALYLNEKIENYEISLTAEVQQLVGRNQVRAIAMSSTDGVQRGMPVVNTEKPITVPVGEKTLGRLFNLLGETIDDGEQLPADNPRMSIHKDAPKFVELSTKAEIFETGIKVVDLLEPYAKGGKTGLFGGAGVGKTVIIQELIHHT